MRKIFKYVPAVMVLSLSLVMTGCKQEIKQADSAKPASEWAPAFQTAPEKIEPHKSADLMVSIKEGDKAIQDAEVKLEVWKEGNEKHEMLDAKYDGKEFYRANNSFDAGKYEYIIHATAKGKHKMPSGQFTVGSESHTHKQSDSKMMIHVMLPKNVKANQPTSIMVHTKEGAKASMCFGYEGDQKHQKVALTQLRPGEYTAKITFPKKGKVDLHVHTQHGKEKGSQEEKITIN